MLDRHDRAVQAGSDFPVGCGPDELVFGAGPWSSIFHGTLGGDASFGALASDIVPLPAQAAADLAVEKGAEQFDFCGRPGPVHTDFGVGFSNSMISALKSHRQFSPSKAPG